MLDTIPDGAEEYAIFLKGFMDFTTPEEIAQLIHDNWDEHESSVKKVIKYLEHEQGFLHQIGKTFNKLWCELYT